MSSKLAKRESPNNYISEWSGHIVWPPEEIDASAEAVRNQTEERCPFLSSATGMDVPCTKKTGKGDTGFRTGFCTASISSSGVREDWLACPSRAFDEPFTLITDAIRLLYGIDADERILVFPRTRFDDPVICKAVRSLDDNARSPRVFSFSSNPPALGGEVDIPETDRSPGNKVDVSIFEVLGTEEDELRLGRFAIFEIQTADFHGSPLHAIRQLRRLGPPGSQGDYHLNIAASAAALGDEVQGPNKANIFKRSIYQMIMKIQMAKDEACVGVAVGLPEPVWRSWGRHFGAPELLQDPHDPDVLHFRMPPTSDEDSVIEAEPAWILVFKVDRASQASPKPLKIVKRIATDSATLIHYAFDVAPEAALEGGATAKFARTFHERLMESWTGRRRRRGRNKSDD